MSGTKSILNILADETENFLGEDNKPILLLHPKYRELFYKFDNILYGQQLIDIILDNEWQNRSLYITYIATVNNVICIDCKQIHRPDNMFLLNDDLWLKLNYKLRDAACIKCVKTRLGRKLELSDFNSSAPINKKWLDFLT